MLNIPEPHKDRQPALMKGAQTGHLIATEEASEPRGGLPGFLTHVKHALIGHPLPTANLEEERISKPKALAIFSSDAISSVAYATEEILLVLMLAGGAALSLSLPISLAIVALIAIVVFSYIMVIHLYPQGGGSYSSSKDNFGPKVALLDGSALMIDYTLTAAVSTSAGVAAVTSAFPALFPYRVDLALAALLFIVLVNLRGVRESASTFAMPTYAFILCMYALIGIGLWKVATGQPPVEIMSHTIPPVTESLGILLILRAFSSGCSAMTGTEAISNGVPSFKDPQPRNASITLIWMAVILATIFLGTGFLAQHYHLVPQHGETLVSQLARTLTGRSPFYYI
ncbi:MAG: APC family permease, partial [Bacteroidota bacterium]